MKVLCVFSLVLCLAICRAQVYDENEDKSRWDENEYENYFDYGLDDKRKTKAESDVEYLNDDRPQDQAAQIQNFIDQQAIEKQIQDMELIENQSKNDKYKDYDSDFEDVEETVKEKRSDNNKEAKDYILIWSDDSVAPIPEEKENRNNDEASFIDTFSKESNENIKANLEELSKSILEITDSKEKIKDKEINGTVKSDARNVLDLYLMNETQSILDNEPDDFELNLSKKIKVARNDISSETKQILEETDDYFDENARNIDRKDVQINHSVETTAKPEEGLVDIALEDLNDDLDKLYETIKKLKDTQSKSEEDIQPASSKSDMEPQSIQSKSDIELQAMNNFLPNDFDNDRFDAFEQLGDDGDSVGLDSIEGIDEISEDSDEFADDDNLFDIEEPLNDNEEANNSEMLLDVEPDLAKFLLDYAEDDKESVEEFSEEKAIETTKTSTEAGTTVTTEKIDQVEVENLNSDELQDLTNQFALLHQDKLDFKSDSFNRDVAPIYIRITADEPTVITSPNFPSPYPTNNIIDWVIEGNGLGIEMNITDFAVNGALGDYLLIKPGGFDDTSNEGLLFTYTLNSPRKYRFMDINKLYIRFEANQGMMFFTGWSMSSKLIDSSPAIEEEPLPLEEAEPLQPNATVTFTFEIDLFTFNNTKDAFVQLLDDMAAMYVDENEEYANDVIDHHIVIQSVATCPINWPNFVQCSAVTFGIALEKNGGAVFMEEQDILNMWFNYRQIAEFASRLEEMGIKDFTPPEPPMMAWLLVTSGVVICMAILGFVMWRYSCFQSYTRMPSFTDTDSIQNEKRGLDLYPTPHQTLPPLYAENEYKWVADDNDTSRVDMGGFANKSYVRNTMYDFESDEEVPKIEKYTTDV